MDPEVEARAEAQRAQDPEVILLKPPIGIADRPDQLLVQVLGTLERVLPGVPDRVVGNRVDREVPACEVVHQGHAELHHGVAAVGADVLAKRRDFMGLVRPIEHGHRAVFDPHGHRALEQTPDLGRRGRGGEIKVVVFESQEVVAHRAAHAPRLIPGRFELRGDLDDRVGNGQLSGKRHDGAR
jgi:hypothetical protein